MSGAAAVRPRALAAWIAVCVVWGTTYLAIRIALETVPPGLLAGLRWTAAGALLALAVRLAGRRLPPPQAWPTLALAGFLMTVMGNGLVVWAEQHVSSGLAAVMVAMVPIWSVIIEAVRGRGERVTTQVAVGLLMGFGGIVVLVWPEVQPGGGGRLFVIGMVALQLACAGWALGSSATKHQDSGADPVATSALQMLFGGLILVVIGTAAGEWSHLHVTPRTLSALVYLVLIGSIVGYTCYVYALTHLPISLVSLYAYVNPIIAVILGALLLGEPFTLRVLAASGLVLAGIAVVRQAQTAG